MGDAAPVDPTTDAKPFTGIAVAALAFAALATAVTVVDFVSSIQPLSPTIAAWRYQASASLAGGLAIPVLAVLELNAGKARRLGLKPGDRVRHPLFGVR